MTITVYESTDKTYCKILVFENEQKLEEIQMPQFNYRNLDSRQNIINQTLLKYMNQGYKRESELMGGVSGVMVTTYLFTK